MADVFRAEALSKCFGNDLALDSLNLSVASGEIVCMLGANPLQQTQ
jgi:ABC-type multidrug transport system ATPase subunit